LGLLGFVVFPPPVFIGVGTSSDAAVDSTCPVLPIDDGKSVSGSPVEKPGGNVGSGVCRIV
jgi:hypothetical protein